MNISAKNPIKKIEGILKIASIVLSIVLIFGASSHAQSINDDLKPKQPVAKPKPAANAPAKTAKPTKTVRKTTSRSARKPSGSTVKSLSNSQVRKSPDNLQTGAVVSETSDQILNRYMSFGQTGSVTNADWNRVVAQTAKTLQDNPNHSIAKAQSLIAQGHIAYNQGNYSMAITQFKSALQILPQSSLPHYSLGRAYLANGQAKAAERSFKEAIDQNENFALAYKGLGDAFAAQGEKKSAAKYVKKATEISVKEGNMSP